MVACICIISCATNPVKNWQCVWTSGEDMADFKSPDAQVYQKYSAVIDDYRDFLVKTKSEHPSWWISTVSIYEDKAGLHAVSLIIGTDVNKYREFYIMYDKSDMRTKVVNGSSWHQFHLHS